MEVLAPAGSVESLKAAVAGGADVVYLGGKEFGARKMAGNFSDHQLKGAVRFAHDHDVDVHVTVNTLVKEGELSKALSFVDLLESIEVDAVIVQDRGLLDLIIERCGIPVHASTQMGIHTPEGADWAKELGVSRVILARELGLNEIENIKNKVDIELEVFIHGALCYSVSGHCLFSSMVGGRSGNRGLCAQPCRMRYELGEEGGYMLSTADLMGAGSIPILLKMGIDCIKIEGRMRGPVYTYIASMVYKNAVGRASRGEDELVTPREMEMLKVAFNRDFTGGHLLGEDLMRRERPDSRGRDLGKAFIKNGIISLNDPSLDSGDGITLYSKDKKVGGFEIEDHDSSTDEVRAKIPFQIQNGTYEAYKTKDRTFDHIENDIAAMEVMELPINRNEINMDLDGSKREERDPEISCYLTSLKAIEKVSPYAERIYFEWGPKWEEARGLCEDLGLKPVLMLPRISPEIPDTDSTCLMVCNPGQFWKFRDRELFGHYSLNVLNSFNVPRIYQQTLSVELSGKEMAEILSHSRDRMEIMAFGRIELMVTRDPTLPEGTLIDVSGRRFPVYRDRMGFAHVLNCADLLLLDYMDELAKMGIDSVGLDLRRRNPNLCGMIAKAFKERDMKKKGNIRRKCGKITAGHYLRGVL